VTDYFYDMDLVVDPLNPANVVANGQVSIFDPADTTGATLLALKDPSGLPLPNPLTSNANGFLPPRIATVPQTMWKSGGFTGYFNSYKGLRDEAVGAVSAAQTAANSASAAANEVVTTAAVDGTGALVLTKASGATVNAGQVKGAKGDKGDKGDKGADGANVLPTDDAIKQAINDTASATRGALNATIDDKVSKITPTSDNQNLAAFGDSLTEPGQWIAELVARQAVAVTNLGKSGQSSSEIAMRQGGLIPKVTVTGGTIPASGPVAVTVDYPTGAFKTNVGGAMANPQYVGKIAGVEGTLVANIQGNPRTWSFTRTTPGTAVNASGQRWFLSTEGPLQVRKEQIFWTGRNFSYDRVITDTADMVAYLKKNVIDPSYTVVSVINGSAEPIGSSEYNAILSRNATLKTTYGEHYCEVRRPLIDSALAWAGITPTANDLADIANDVVPRSLQVGDGFHLNAKGQEFVGKLIAEHRTRLGYDRTGAILAANIGADPVYVPPTYSLSVTGASRRYVASSLADSKVGTVITQLDSVGEPGEPKFLRPVVSGSGATLRNAGGVKYLEFDGVANRMYVPAFTVAQPYTFAVVYKLRSTGTSKVILSLINGTPASPTLRREANGNIVFDAGSAQPVVPGAALGTTWHLAYISVNGASTIIGIDGTTATPGTPGTGSVTGLRIGQGASDYSDIDVAEVVMWDRALTSGELASVRTDMKAQYAALP